MTVQQLEAELFARTLSIVNRDCVAVGEGVGVGVMVPWFVAAGEEEGVGEGEGVDDGVAGGVTLISTPLFQVNLPLVLLQV